VLQQLSSFDRSQLVISLSLTKVLAAGEAEMSARMLPAAIPLIIIVYSEIRRSMTRLQLIDEKLDCNCIAGIAHLGLASAMTRRHFVCSLCRMCSIVRIGKSVANNVFALRD
jgi:hypothetical protein